jgi:hypothetical protein
MLFLVRPGDRQSLLLKIKLTSSRATAVFATLLFLPLWINRKYLLFKRTAIDQREIVRIDESAYLAKAKFATYSICLLNKSCHC